MTPVEGEIRLKGQKVTKPGPDRMMVFQEFDQLLPWKTVKENVMFALTASGRLNGKAAEEKAREYINKVNLTKFADSFPHTLSGGMKQRVAIARGMLRTRDIEPARYAFASSFVGATSSLRLRWNVSFRKYAQTRLISAVAAM